MRTVNMRDARTHPSRLVEQAAVGKPFVIAKSGRPMVKVVPIDAPTGDEVHRIGFLKEQFEVPDDLTGSTKRRSQASSKAAALPPLVPVDRMSVAKAIDDGPRLVTADRVPSRYDAPVKLV